MKWQEVTAIYIIGNRFPVATFLHENQAVEWAETTFPGEWITKQIKIPNMPVTPKTSVKAGNLKDLAARLANLEWSSDEEDEDGGGISL